MKKTLKLVLPFLLIFALVIAGYWFFFQYRADLTTGLLRNVADSQMLHLGQRSESPGRGHRPEAG